MESFVDIITPLNAHSAVLASFGPEIRSVEILNPSHDAGDFWIHHLIPILFGLTGFSSAVQVIFWYYYAEGKDFKEKVRKWLGL